VREAADLVALIGEHVELRRTGTDYRGPCPFHGGTHRNFAVIPKKGMYYCFVCHEAGDVFTFYMKRLGLDYPSAVREVAGRVGITIPERGATGPDPREPLFAAVAAAHDWFVRQLREAPEGETARQYLAGRGLDLETALLHGLGFAPRGSGLLEAMTTLGLKEPVLLEAGLLARTEDGRVVPRFRRRLLFPIHDVRGRVVGFGGRLLGEGEPKYLNSPDTPVFHKGRMLYNLHAAKQAIRKAERAVLVEGYFDVLRVALAGVEEVVAPLGTGLTADQAALVARYTSHVVLLYDPDDAGLRATFRAGDQLLRQRLRVSVATLPEGEDPDAFVLKAGAAGLARLLGDAVDLVERKIQILERRGFFGSLPGRRRALDGLLPTLRAADDPITRDLYLTRIAEVTGIRKDVLEREAGGEGKGKGEGGRVGPIPPSPFPLPLPANAEKALLLLLLAGEPWRSRVIEAVAPEDFEHPAYAQVFAAVVDDALLSLDQTAARILEDLRAEGLGDRDGDAMLTRAVSWLEARRLERELDQIDRQMPLGTPEQQTAWLSEKRRVFDELRKRYPRYKIARRTGASGS
jgi:DNA primase